MFFPSISRRRRRMEFTFFLLHHLSFRFDAHPIEVSSVFTNAFGASIKKSKHIFWFALMQFLGMKCTHFISSMFLREFRKRERAKKAISIHSENEFSWARVRIHRLLSNRSMWWHVHALIPFASSYRFFSTVSCSLYLFNLYLYIS